jgi:hypothetical protein
MTSKRRTGVQSIALRASFLHLRFSMHRPYASFAHGEKSKYVTSREISINAAQKLIALSAHGPEMFNHAAVSSHLSWCPMHSFSAAMFFCFQIINNPEQGGAKLLRAYVLRAIKTLELCRGVRTAEEALHILGRLSPLYAEEFLSDTPEDRERKKQDVLPTVRRLQFPGVDSLNVPIGPVVEGAGFANGTLSPTQSSAHADSPPCGPGPGPDPMQTSHSHSSVQSTAAHAPEPEIQTMLTQVSPATMLQPQQHHMLHQHQQLSQHPTCESLPSFKWPHANLPAGDPTQYPGQRQHGHSAAMQHELQQYPDALPRHPAEDEEAIWRSAAACHSPVATMMGPEPAAASASPSRAPVLYAQQQMMQQQQAQGAYSQHGGGGDGIGGGHGAMDERMGLRVVAEGVLWGAGGFVQGEWDRMYTELGCHT